MPAEELEEIDAKLAVQRTRWLRAQIERLLAQAKLSERDQIDAVLVQQLNEAIVAKDPKQLELFVNCFATHPLAEKAREALVDRLSGNDSGLEREFLLAKLEKSSNLAPKRGDGQDGCAACAMSVSPKMHWQNIGDLKMCREPAGVGRKNRAANSGFNAG